PNARPFLDERTVVSARPAKAQRRSQGVVPARCTDPRYREVVVGADLAPGAGTSAFQGTSAIRTISLNPLAGLSRGLRGLELSGLLGVDRAFACGVQVAGGLNLVGGPVEGLQLAGGVNVAAGALHGVQAAGGYNHARGVRGQQLGVVNVD